MSRELFSLELTLKATKDTKETKITFLVHHIESMVVIEGGTELTTTSGAKHAVVETVKAICDKGASRGVINPLL